MASPRLLSPWGRVAAVRAVLRCLEAPISVACVRAIVVGWRLGRAAPLAVAVAVQHDGRPAPSALCERHVASAREHRRGVIVSLARATRTRPCPARGHKCMRTSALRAGRPVPGRGRRAIGTPLAHRSPPASNLQVENLCGERKVVRGPFKTRHRLAANPLLRTGRARTGAAGGMEEEGAGASGAPQHGEQGGGLREGEWYEVRYSDGRRPHPVSFVEWVSRDPPRCRIMVVQKNGQREEAIVEPHALAPLVVQENGQSETPIVGQHALAPRRPRSEREQSARRKGLRLALDRRRVGNLSASSPAPSGRAGGGDTAADAVEERADGRSLRAPSGGTECASEGSSGDVVNQPAPSFPAEEAHASAMLAQSRMKTVHRPDKGTSCDDDEESECPAGGAAHDDADASAPTSVPRGSGPGSSHGGLDVAQRLEFEGRPSANQGSNGRVKRRALETKHGAESDLAGDAVSKKLRVDSNEGQAELCSGNTASVRTVFGASDFLLQAPDAEQVHVATGSGSLVDAATPPPREGASSQLSSRIGDPCDRISEKGKEAEPEDDLGGAFLPDGCDGDAPHEEETSSGAAASAGHAAEHSPGESSRSAAQGRAEASDARKTKKPSKLKLRSVLGTLTSPTLQALYNCFAL